MGTFSGFAFGKKDRERVVLAAKSAEAPRGTVSSPEAADAAIARLVEHTDSRIPRAAVEKEGKTMSAADARMILREADRLRAVAGRATKAAKDLGKPGPRGPGYYNELQVGNATLSDKEITSAVIEALESVAADCEAKAVAVENQIMVVIPDE